MRSPIHASGLLESRHGLSDGKVWWVLCQLILSVPDQTQPMLIHPLVALDLLNGITWTYASHLQNEFRRSDGRIFCIFPADGHWAFFSGKTGATRLVLALL